MRTVKLPRLVNQAATARFVLSFDNSTSPDQVQFLDGDESLRGSTDALQKLEFALRFPDVSSIKIIRMGTVSCDGTECKFELQPLNSMQQSTHPQVAVGAVKR